MREKIYIVFKINAIIGKYCRLKLSQHQHMLNFQHNTMVSIFIGCYDEFNFFFLSGMDNNADCMEQGDNFL